VPRRHELEALGDDLVQPLALGARVVVDGEVDGVAPVVHQGAQADVEVRVAGGGQAAHAGHQIMRDVGREAADIAQRADLLLAVAREHGLGRVLDDLEAVPARDLQDRVHVRGQAEQVHGDDGPRPARDLLLELLGLERVGESVHVREHRLHPVMQDDVGRRHEGHRRHDDLVAVLPPIFLLQSLQGDVQGGRAGVEEHGVLGVMLLGEARLEAPVERPVGEPPGVQHLVDVPAGAGAGLEPPDAHLSPSHA
jgi:hypothetical protein